MADLITPLINSISNMFTPIINRKKTIGDTKIPELNGVNGQAIIVDPLGELFPSSLLKKIRIIDSDTALNSQKNSVESFADVFNTWKRISHNNTDVYPASATELNSWSLSGNVLSSTINSATLIGFISPDKYSDYVYEVVVKSSGADDDLIGICVGYFEDQITGKQHTLTAMRTTGGVGYKLFTIAYNYIQADAVNVGSTNGGLKWGDGVVNDARAIAGGTYGNWSLFTNGCRIKVTRVGDILTFETTDLNTSVYVETAKVTLDLNSRPELAVFKNASPVGYVCYSQTAATFTSINRPTFKSDILDLRDKSIWRWNVGLNDWEKLPNIFSSEEFIKGIFYKDTLSTKLMYCDDESNLIAIR